MPDYTTWIQHGEIPSKVSWLNNESREATSDDIHGLLRDRFRMDSDMGGAIDSVNEEPILGDADNFFKFLKDVK